MSLIPVIYGIDVDDLAAFVLSLVFFLHRPPLQLPGEVYGQLFERSLLDEHYLQQDQCPCMLQEPPQPEFGEKLI